MKLTSSSIIDPRSDFDWCWYLRRQGRAGEMLERALHDIGVMQPGGWADWQPSTMTNTGSPVEMKFAADSSTLSLRTEVDDPANDPRDRVAKAYKLISELGDTPPPLALRDVIAAAQGSAALTFGALLGLRHDGKTMHTTLFAEIPTAAADLTGLLSRPQIMGLLRAFGDGTEVAMLGYDCATGEISISCDSCADLRATLPILTQMANVPIDPILTLIDQMVANSDTGAEALRHWGFRLFMHPDNDTPSLMVTLPANALFTSDANIISKIKACPGERTRPYLALADQLLAMATDTVHHGQIGLTARPGAMPLVSIAVAAPWVYAHDSV